MTGRSFRIPCWFNRHDPRRDEVKWDGRSYIGVCRACGKPIWRRKHKLWLAREE